VIVNDGSSDRTEEIISEYQKRHNWIQLIRNGDTSERKRGSKIVRAFYAGFNLVKNFKYDFIVKLDGDLSFAPDFFERILLEFNRNNRLGISSGVSFINIENKWVEEKSAKGHTLGATKVYRKECFEDIGGLVPFIGWDGIDEIKARMLGWDAMNIPDLVVYHYRPEGKASGKLKAFYEDGEGAYFMGYHPLFMICRGIIRMKSYPYVVGGLNMLYAYIVCCLKRMEKINDNPFIEFLRREQIKKLMLRKSLV
jgi:glycosyltransferase involved in cell wall biosynthesis